MASEKHMSVPVLEERIQRSPGSLAFSRLADAFRKRGDISEAINVCKQGLARHPNYVTGHIILGRCFLEQENQKEAIEEFTKACLIDRRNPLALKMMADVYSRQGMEEKAGDLYAYLLDMDPENASLVKLGKQFRGGGKVSVFEILGVSLGSADSLMSKTAELAPRARKPEPKPGISEDVLDMAIPQMGAPTVEMSRSDLRIGLDTPTVEFPRAALPVGPETEAYARDEAQDLGTAAMPVEELGTVTGDDVSSRLGAIFGEEAKPEAARAEREPLGDARAEADETLEVVRQDSDDISNAVKAAETVELSGALEIKETGDMPEASDITSRIEELFGEEPKSAAGVAGVQDMPIPEAMQPVTEELRMEVPPRPEPDADLETGAMSGDDVRARIEEMFGDSSSTPAAKTKAAPSPEPEVLEPSFEAIEPEPQPVAEVQATPEADLELDADLFDAREALTDELPEESGVSSADASVVDDDTPDAVVADEAGDNETGVLERADATVSEDIFAPEPVSPDLVDDLSARDLADGTAREELPDLQPETAPSDAPTSLDEVDDDVANAETVIMDRRSLGAMPPRADTPRVAESRVSNDDIGVVSGADVSSRLDELFGEDEGAGQLSASMPEVAARPAMPTIEEGPLDMTAVDDLPVLESAADAASRNDETAEHSAILDETAAIESDWASVDSVMGEEQTAQAIPSGDDVARRLEHVFDEDGPERGRDDVLGDGLSGTVTEDTGLTDVDDTVRAAVKSAETVIYQRAKKRDKPDETLDATKTAETVIYSRKKPEEPKLDPLVDEIVDSEETRTVPATSVEGVDVARRLTEMFGDDDAIASSSKLDAIPDEEGDETVGGGFYNISGEDAERGKEGAELLEEMDPGRLDEPPHDVAEVPSLASGRVKVVTDMADETLEMPPAQLEADAENGLSDSESYSIPDHVLTPTLADIYYQQGQPQLAIQIYERILQRDGGNERIRQRIEQIRSGAVSTAAPRTPELPMQDEADEAEETIAMAPPTPTPSTPPAARKTAPRAEKPRAAKPLHGVKIKKKYKERLKKGK